MQQGVRHAVRLNGMEPLEEKQGFEWRLARRVAIVHRGQIGARRDPDLRAGRNTWRSSIAGASSVPSRWARM
jgi:hypothetical protein